MRQHDKLWKFLATLFRANWRDDTFKTLQNTKKAQFIYPDNPLHVSTWCNFIALFHCSVWAFISLVLLPTNIIEYCVLYWLITSSLSHVYLYVFFPPLSNNKSSNLAWLMLLKKVFPTPCNAGDTSNNGGVQNAFVKPSPRPRSKLSRTNTGSSDHSDDSLDSPKPKRVRHETEINCVDYTLSPLKKLSIYPDIFMR